MTGLLIQNLYSIKIKVKRDKTNRIKKWVLLKGLISCIKKNTKF